MGRYLIILALALLCGAEVQAAGLRRSPLAMSLAEDEEPILVAKVAPPTSEPRPSSMLAEDSLPLQEVPAPHAAAPASVAAAAVPTPVAAAATPVAVAAAPVAAAPLAAVALSSDSPAAWAATVAKKTTDEALLTMFGVAEQLKAVCASTWGWGLGFG